MHLIPLLVSGLDPFTGLYFGNSISRLIQALSQHTELQVEYNRERVHVTAYEILHHIFPFLPRRLGARK